jgi:hypothetical protein
MKVRAAHAGVLVAIATALAAGVVADADAARARKAHPRVLATGDSMIQIVDGFLARRLDHLHARVRTSASVGTGISKPFLLDWVRRAHRQAARVRPAATVVFIGANDGFPFGRTGCCGPAWVRAYASRVGQMMRYYRRGGKGWVYWLTLPAPRPHMWQRPYRAVNKALRRAARGFPNHVRLIDTARVFTPDGRFRATIRWHHRTVVARQPDGIHLSVAGAQIAAGLVVKAMVRDRALR